MIQVYVEIHRMPFIWNFQINLTGKTNLKAGESENYSGLQVF